MARIIITSEGNKHYLNDDNEYHRLDGPSSIFKSGATWWFINGVQTNRENPSDIYRDGSVAWYVENKIERNNGPAFDEPTGLKKWHIKGEIIWPKL